MTAGLVPAGVAVARWRVWSTSASVVVTDPGALADTRAMVETELAAVDRACSRFRPDSELARAERSGGPVEVSTLLAELVGAALDAARRSGGDVDPALGAELARLGYDRDIALVRTSVVRPSRFRCGPRPAGGRSGCPGGCCAMTGRLHVDRTACDGRGLCAELLDRDPWGYPVPREHGPALVPAELTGHARRAVALCPVLALRLE